MESGPETVIFTSGDFGADFTQNSLPARYRLDLLHLPITNGKLYNGDAIQVDEVLPTGVPPPGIGGVGFGSSHNLAMDHIICELCLSSERGMGISMDLADPVSRGKYSGMCVSTGPVAESTVMSLAVSCCVVACGFVAEIGELLGSTPAGDGHACLQRPLAVRVIRDDSAVSSEDGIEAQRACRRCAACVEILGPQARAPITRSSHERAFLELCCASDPELAATEVKRSVVIRVTSCEELQLVSMWCASRHSLRSCNACDVVVNTGVLCSRAKFARLAGVSMRSSESR